MNVVFITNSIGYGGAEKMMNFVTDCLAKNGNSVLILNLNTVNKHVNAHQQVFNKDISVITLCDTIGSKHAYRIKKIIHTIKEFKADVIVAFTMFPNFYAKIASWLTGIPSIMSERGDPNRTFTKSIKDRFILSVINLSQGAVFQTKEASLFYSRSLQKRGIVIPNPIFLNNPPNLNNWGPRPKTIVSVGRFQNIQKRYDIMLKAFKEFSSSHSDYILKLYGSGEDELLIRQWINELQLDNKVLMPGTIENAIEKISKEGIFIITSDYEGIPNALLEAMAAGLPVVATDCSPGGAKLLIKNNVNGQIVQSGDIHAIATALARYAENEDFAKSCANNARLVLQTYNPKRIGEYWISYIKQIAEA